MTHKGNFSIVVPRKSEFLSKNRIFDSAAGLGTRPVVARTEWIAANIADSFKRMTNGKQIGVVAVQDGSGAEAAFAEVAQARSLLPDFCHRTEKGGEARTRGNGKYNLTKFRCYRTEKGRGNND